MAIQSHTALFHRRILYDKMHKRRAEVHEGWRHWRLQCHCCGGRPALLWILQNTSKTIPLGLGGGLVSIGKNCSAETTAKPRKHQKTTSLGLGGGLVSTGKTIQGGPQGSQKVEKGHPEGVTNDPKMEGTSVGAS